ncbi:MobC family plasmid mobilization relaxosome protein [Actinomyces naeslundii]|uniref:MobC family plasmid mobilization relaxosome protein n=1 Tax=Actinomyces naeslundii TaxID=1655 RepID=UPI002093E91F|nr:MobC family plasmid mobilization relaxosome protein [Actinomyces naeslundii]
MTSTVDDAGVVTRGPRLDRRRSARTQGVRRGRLTVYLTDEERSLLEARSEVSGESMAKILVDCALHPVSAGEGVDAGGVHELVAQLRDYRRQLVGVTTNLNQIAHHANTTSEVPADFAAVVAEVHQLHDDINAILVGARRS